MVRGHAPGTTAAPIRRLYPVRGLKTVSTPTNSCRRVRNDDGLDVAYAYTRRAPDGWGGVVGRLDAARLAVSAVGPASLQPRVFVCGPTGFVEAAADLLVEAGHAPGHIRTERFGPSGG